MMATVTLAAEAGTLETALLLIEREAREYRRLSMHTNKSHDLRRTYAETANALEALALQLRQQLRG